LVWYLNHRLRTQGAPNDQEFSGKDSARGDWEKLLAYGERVRRITYNESLSNVSASIFTVFERDRPRTYLFPNLRRLKWKAETADGLGVVPCFLNPGVGEFILEIGTKLPRLDAFLADICSRTALKGFSFTSPSSLPQNFTEVLHPQTALEKVALESPGALGPAVGRWTASLPALRTLQLDLTGRSPIAVEGFFDDVGLRSGDSTPSSVGSTDSGVFSGDELDFSEIRKSALRLTGGHRSKGTFPHLRHVHLTGAASNVAVFLRHLTSPLERLELVIDDPPDKSDWQELSTLVSERFGASIRSLRIGPTGASCFSELVRSTSRAGPPTHRLSLEYLAAMPQLARFEVELPESVIFHERDIDHLAKVCPRLETLKLCPLRTFPNRTALSYSRRNRAPPERLFKASHSGDCN
jgi:hypothetical protein